MVRSDTTSDERLVGRARNGDGDAFRMLVDRYEGLVAATVIGMLGRGPDAEDVGQETFIRFYRALDRFRGDSSVGTYLTRIAINQSLKAIRKRKSLMGRFTYQEPEQEGFPDDSADLAASLDDRERNRLIEQALQTLGEEHRAVVVLRMLQEYSTRETAELLGVPEGTVMSRLSRALEKLEKVLAPAMRDPAASSG